MPHDGHHTHGADFGHNHGPSTEHLHSHPVGSHGQGEANDAVQDWIDNFVPMFRAADDKTGFLRLAKVPFELEDSGGGPSLKLVDVMLADSYQVGTASPAFASEELMYQPFPGPLVRQRTDATFTYVSLRRRQDISLSEMASRISMP